MCTSLVLYNFLKKETLETVFDRLRRSERERIKNEFGENSDEETTPAVESKKNEKKKVKPITRKNRNFQGLMPVQTCDLKDGDKYDNNNDKDN